MAPREGPWPYHSRDLEGAWRAIEDLRYAVDRLDRADEIAKAVTTRMKRDTVLGLNTLQKAVTAIAGGIVMAAAICQLFGIHL